MKRTRVLLVGALLLMACGNEPGQKSYTTSSAGKADKAGAPMNPNQNMTHAYELSATKEVAGLSSLDFKGKRAAVNVAVDQLVARAAKTPGVSLQVGTNQMDRLDFPPVVIVKDGVQATEAATKLELSLWNDAWMLAATQPAHGIALRWSIVVHSDGDELQVILGVPETFTRLYFRGEPSMPSLDFIARMYHKTLRTLVHTALNGSGFDTRIDLGIPGTEMGESAIAAFESMMGPITPESIAPRLNLSGVTAKAVVQALETAFSAPRVPPFFDMDGDGVPDDFDGDGNPDPGASVLPYMFGRYMSGDPNFTFETMAAMMSQGPMLWNNGMTFQQWANPRTLDLSSALYSEYHVIELCQPFYAGTALSTGLHHVPSMPCAVSVWEEGGQVKLSLLDPTFIFAYLFADAGPQMDPRMQQLFSVFPVFVYNEMVGIVNAAMADLGLQDRLALQSFPAAP